MHYGVALREDLVHAETLAHNLSLAVDVQVTPDWRQDASPREEGRHGFLPSSFGPPKNHLQRSKSGDCKWQAVSHLKQLVISMCHTSTPFPHKVSNLV